MKHVSVVGTRHEEIGKATVAALVSILERIDPEVIFLEMPPEAFDDYFDGTRTNLELRATSRYCENHQVTLVPVDLPTPEAAFFRKQDDLARELYHLAYDYFQLIESQIQLVSEHGFAYLNSEQCSTLYSDVDKATIKAIDRLGNRGRAEFFESWTRTIQRRDEAMVANIVDYCRQNSFSRGALLVGAAHRQAIEDLSRRPPGGESSAIDWDFSRFLEEPRA
jgi:hypothetical protein